MLNTLQHYLKNAIHTAIDHEQNFSNLMPHFNHHADPISPMMQYKHNVFMLHDWILQYVMTSTPPEKKEAFDQFISTVLSALRTKPDSEVCLAIIHYLKIIISLHDQANDKKKKDIANALASEDYSKCLEGSSERLFNITQQYEDSNLLSRLLSLTQLFYQQQASRFIQDKKLISHAGHEIHMVTALMKLAFQTLDIPHQTISNDHVEAQKNQLSLPTLAAWCIHVKKAWNTEFLAFAADQIFPNTYSQSDPARVVVCDLLPSKLHDNTLYVVREGKSVTLSIQKKSIGPPQKSTIRKSKTKAFIASEQPEKDVETTTIPIKTILFGQEHETSQKWDDSAHDRLLNNLVGSDYFKQSLINHLAVNQPMLLPAQKENDLPYQPLLPDNADKLLYYLGLNEQRDDSQTTRQALLLRAANAAHADASPDTMVDVRRLGTALKAIGSSLVTHFTTAAGGTPTATSHAPLRDAHTELWKTSETFQTPSWLLSQYLEYENQAEVIFFDAWKSSANGAYTQAWILGDLLPCMLTFHRSLPDKEKLMDIFLNNKQYKALCLLLQHDSTLLKTLLKTYTWRKCHAPHPKLFRTMIRDFPDLLISLLQTNALNAYVNNPLPLDKGEYALLHLASLDDKNADLVRELLKRHANPLQESSEHQSIPLQHAATLGNTSVIQALLDENNGVDPNTQSRSIKHRTNEKHGLTSLELAFSFLHLEAAQLLIERGATLDNDEKIYRCVDNIIKNSHKDNIDIAAHTFYLLLQSIPYRSTRSILLQDIAKGIHNISATNTKVPKSHKEKLLRALRRDQQFGAYRKRSIIRLKSFIAIYRVIRVIAAIFAILNQREGLQKVDEKIKNMRIKLEIWVVDDRTTPSSLQSLHATGNRFRFFSSTDGATHRKGPNQHR